MKIGVFVLMILGAFVADVARADYTIGEFTAPQGPACNATITTERCGPTLTTKCYENGSLSQKAGVKMTKTDCSGGNATSAYTYDGEVGTGIYYQGELNDCSALTALKNNSSVTKEPGYAWFVKNLGTGYDAGKLYIWTNNDFPTCPSGGVPFQGPQGAQGEGICDGVADPSVAIKNTVRSYEGPTSSARGYMKLHHTKCNDSTADDQIKDECVPIIAASTATCAGTYLECKPQGTYTGNNNYAKYNVCESTTGTTIASALSNKEDTLCVGANAQSSSVERKKTVEYTAPSGSGTYGAYSWKTGVGKIVNKSVKCDGSTSTISSTPDKCEEIERPNASVCSDTGKVYYECTQQDNNTTYKLCATGSSMLSAAQSAAQSAAATAAAAVDPCGGSTSSTQIKSTSTTSYNRGTKTNDVYSSVGKSTITKTACDGSTTYTAYEQDDCVEIAKPAGKCTAATSAYLRCTTSSSSIDPTYYVCQDLGSNNSLASKIDEKLDNSSSLDASKLTGTIDNARLSNKVITTENLSDKLAANNVITEDNLADKLADNDEAVFNFGASGGSGVGLTLKEVVDLLHAVTGDCTVNNSGMGSTISCGSGTNGALGKNVSITRQLSTSN